MLSRPAYCCDAFHMNTFEAEYKSIDDMLNRRQPRGYRLRSAFPWKDSVSQEKIFGVNYTDFSDNFHRLLLVMGVEDHARLYSYNTIQ